MKGRRKYQRRKRLKPKRLLNVRDKNGWRIPRPGTLSRSIYDQINSGLTPMQIAARIEVDVGKIRVLSHRFRTADRG